MDSLPKRQWEERKKIWRVAGEVDGQAKQPPSPPPPPSSALMAGAALPSRKGGGREEGHRDGMCTQQGGTEGAVALQAVHFGHWAIRSSGFRLVAKKRGIDSMVRSACLSFPFLPFIYLFPHFFCYFLCCIPLFLDWCDITSPQAFTSPYRLKSLGDTHRTPRTKEL